MRTRLLIVLSLIVILPLVLLAGLGLRWINSEQQALEHRFQNLIDVQLQAIDTTIQDYFANSAARILADIPTLDLDTESLRNYSKNFPQIRQVFVMTANGERLHPPADALLNTDEQEFLTRTRMIWREKTLLYQTSGSDTQTARPDHYGWYVWYWGVETQLIFWFREQSQSSGRILGFELDPVRILDDIINRLPATGGDSDTLGTARIRLSDNRDAIIYQWGEFEPPEQQVALLTRPLSHPLSSWHLAYFAPASSAGEGQLRLLTVAIFAAVALVLAALAFYLYREHSREMRLAQQRVNFVNQVSHELKTPLTNIRMYAELLEDQLLDEEPKTQRYLTIIVNESQRLSRLISNVLNFAGLQKDRLQIHWRPGCVDEVIETALTTFRPILQSKNMMIDWRADAGADVQLDPDILEQILNNLLSNVEKYAATGERLEISSWQQAEFSYIRIQDYGPGIARRERERIFRPFYRISSKLNDGIAGTGIGLTITRELARLHGGELELVASDQGACFQVSLYTPHSSAKGALG